MGSTQTEALEPDSYAADVSAGETKHDGNPLGTEAFESNPCMSPAETVGNLQCDIAVGSAQVEKWELAGGSDKAGLGDEEAAQGSMALGNKEDAKEAGSEPVNEMVVSAKREPFECNPGLASDRQVAMMASTRAKGFKFEDSAGTMVNFRVFPEEEVLTTSPKDLNRKQEATVSSLEHNEAHGTVPSSIAHGKQEVMVTSCIFSNHRNSDRSYAGGPCPTDNIDVSKFGAVVFHNLEANQGPEHAYDMDFDLDAHGMPLEESFFEDNCIFQALDGDKTEAWHTDVDDVMMEESSAQLGSKQHVDLDRETIPVEVKNESVGIHDMKENVVRKEGWLHDTQHRPGCETTLTDSVHGVKESSGLIGNHVQGHEEPAASPCNQTDAEILVSHVVQDKELAGVDSEGADVQEMHLQYDTDDIFASLSGENVETVHDAEIHEAKRLEEEENAEITVSENEIEDLSVKMTHQDADTGLYDKLDHDLAEGCSSISNAANANVNPISKDVQLPKKSEVALEGSGPESCPGQEETMSQIEVQEKGAGQGSGCSDSEKKDECTDERLNEADAHDQVEVQTVTEVVMQERGIGVGRECLDLVKKDECGDEKLNEAYSCDRLVVQNTAKCLETPCTDSGAFTLNDKTQPECVHNSSVQGDIASLITCRETFVEEAVPESLAHEEAITIKQIALHDRPRVNGNGEPEYVPTCSEQGKSASLVVCKETSMEGVSESSAQEEAITFKQCAIDDTPAVKNCKSQYGHDILSHTKDYSVHSGEVQKQSNGPVLMDGKSVDDFDDNALVQKSNDEKGICESGDETLEEGKDAKQEETASDKEHEQCDGKPIEDHISNCLELKKSDDEVLMSVDRKSMDEFDDVLGMGHGDEKEIYESSPEIVQVGKVAEQEETASNKELEQHDDGKSVVQELGRSDEELYLSGGRVEGEEGNVAEEAEKALDEGHRQSDGDSFDDFDDSMSEMQKCDLGEILVSGDGNVQDKVTEPEEEKEAAANEELAVHCLTRQTSTWPALAVSAKETRKQEACTEAAIHLPSSPDPEANVSSCTDLSQQFRTSGGPNDNEKSAAQSSAPLEEESRQMRGFSTDASSPKPSEKKGIGVHKLRKAEIPNKLKFRTEKKPKVTENLFTHSQPELEEELFDKPQKPVKEGTVFGIGDLVWAKVRSHPWWPAQIFDPADASKSARKAKKSGRVLVAFFGDCTFAWLQQSQMIAFCPNFKEKVQQTSMRIFCLAVEEALEELCRRSELGLSCKHFKGSLHSTSSFPDANTGIRQGVRVERLKGVCVSAETFRPKKTLEFVKSVACSPLGSWSFTLQWSECRGHAYGLRTCMVALQGSDLAPVLQMLPAVSFKGSKQKRSYSSCDVEDLTEIGSGGKGSTKNKKLKYDKDRKDSDSDGSLVSGEVIRGLAMGNVGVRSTVTDTRVGKKDSNTLKIKLNQNIKKDHPSSFEKRVVDTASGMEVGDQSMLDDSKETLLEIAGHSAKALKRSSLKEERVSSTCKRMRKQIREESQNDACAISTKQAVKKGLVEGAQDGNAEALTRMETDTEDASTVLPSPSRDGGKKMEVSKMSIDSMPKKEGLIKVNSTGKSEVGRKLSKVGNSIIKVASELTGSAVAKVDDSRRTRLEMKKGMESSTLECQASPPHNKVVAKDSSEDVSLLQLRRDLELLAKKAGPGGAKGVAVKQLKKGSQAEASSPHWQSASSYRSQRSCVQELALAARKRKSEIAHDEVTSKLPKINSTMGSQLHHVSKSYITSAEKPGECRSYDKNLLLYSRRPAPPTSSVRGSGQRYDEKLSSHMPLGLFMRFPEDFPLPSEAQLKAAFVPFGPLQMSATRIYNDSASAQVVFKHGRDAESALRHAKKNPMFGPVAVTYRLRHLSHSLRVETKGDASPSSKAYSSQTATPVREKLDSSNASSERRAGNKEMISSAMPSSSNYDTLPGSEPTGDIQAQMMTLLRQVSVIVNTSPVTSDGT